MRVAIAAIAKNEALYLREWLAYHVLLGISDFIIYDNESTDDTSVILREAQNCKIITRTWDTVEGSSPQISAYNDIVKKYSSFYDFCFFIDIDEFLLPTADLNITTILSQLSSEVARLELINGFLAPPALLTMTREWS